MNLSHRLPIVRNDHVFDLKRTRCMLLGALLVFAWSAVSAAPAEPVVHTTSGALRGASEGSVEAFLGIPYAAPPVGANRWRAPRPIRPWHGIRDATHYAASCFQATPSSFGPFTTEFVALGTAVSEDCLYLNIWTPTRRVAALPVFVWIHGGGFGSGSGSLSIYDGRYLAAKGAVVVTINYRLGAFGFLAHPALSRESAHAVSGNYGLLDMIAALQWVKSHIADFGGDPARITVGGQSAGAIAVNDLLVSPLARGLITGAISESGSGMGVKAEPLAEAEAQGLEFAREAHARSLESLRALPAESVLALSKSGPPKPGDTQSSRPRTLAPVLDHYVLDADPDSPTARVLVRVPLITGFNTDEGQLFGVQRLSPSEFEAMVQSRYGAAAAQFLAVYPHANAAEAEQSAIQIARDRYMASLVMWLEGRTAQDGAPIYPYLYEHPFPGPERERFGTFHTSEVPYVFGVLDQGGRPFGAEDRAVAEQLSAYWLNFMRTGDPNGADLPRWAPAATTATRVMGLGDHPGERPAVSSTERLAAFRAFVASGGQLSLF